MLCLPLTPFILSFVQYHFAQTALAQMSRSSRRPRIEVVAEVPGSCGSLSFRQKKKKEE
jgi:hypothetical protein